jgi:hypothetical protein
MIWDRKSVLAMLWAAFVFVVGYGLEMCWLLACVRFLNAPTYVYVVAVINVVVVGTLFVWIAYRLWKKTAPLGYERVFRPCILACLLTLLLMEALGLWGLVYTWFSNKTWIVWKILLMLFIVAHWGSVTALLAYRLWTWWNRTRFRRAKTKAHDKNVV